MSPGESATQKIDRALTEGVGGLRFTAQSPPGIGRLIRIPFYHQVATAGYASLGVPSLLVAVGAAVAGGAGIASAIEPMVTVGPPAAIGATNTAQLQTPQISWALLRIVGFECSVQYPVVPATDAMDLAFSDLQIGGGANLFVHENFGPAGIYLMGQDSFAGLRDYPILQSPNTATVNIQGVGSNFSAPLTFSANLVCEILQDDNYGAHVPGPYARSGAMVRKGGSFV
tara:strand:- start:15781 stop:16464 length:684 start_codon:yes stop_codon:yes gene_type:complete